MQAIDMGPVMGLLRSLVGGCSHGDEDEVKLFRMTGEQLRERIQTSIDSCKVMRELYVKALADQRPGYDWQYAIDNCDRNVIEYGAYVSFVSDGPFDLTPGQFIMIVNKFSTMRTPDEILAHREAESRKRRQQARDAILEKQDTANLGGSSN